MIKPTNGGHWSLCPVKTQIYPVCIKKRLVLRNIWCAQWTLWGDTLCTVKPVLSGHSKRRPKLVFKTNCRLMQAKSIEECSKGSILQYFRPSLSYLQPFVIKIFVLSIFRVAALYRFYCNMLSKPVSIKAGSLSAHQRNAI